MTALANNTPFAARMYSGMDAQARVFDVVALSATFDVRPHARIRPADEQPPPCDGDVFHGEPGASSVRREGEIAPGKPRVDVVVVDARAHAPGGRPAKRVGVSLRVGDVHKELLVTGDRHWRPGLLGMTPGSPRPFQMMPLRYERAFGGTVAGLIDPAKRSADPRNPVGIGFRGARSADPSVESTAPNVEYPAAPLRRRGQRPFPAGLGVVARSWQPRLALAGTYDAAWTAEQCPLLPFDFDPAHHQSVPPDQQSDTLRGGEPVELLNLTPEGGWRFTLPALDVPVQLWTGRRHRSAALRLDTVLLEPDAHRVTLLARLMVPTLRNRPPLTAVVLGQMSPAWARARATGKRYLDRAQTQGRLADAPHFVA